MATRKASQHEADLARAAAAPAPLIDPISMEGLIPPAHLPQPGDRAEMVQPSGVPMKHVRALRNESADAGGAHYTLRVGAIMDLPAPVADRLIAQRLVEEI